MKLTKTLTAVIAGAAATIALPAFAQDVDGDANSPLVQWSRMNAPAGTFWLDSNDDTELIRYTSPRDVELCLPEPGGVGAADEGYPLRISWDGQYSAVLRPGNCFYFDASRVQVKPAEPLPQGVTLTGRVRTESALRD
ncbi:hypothetical protein GCM10011371_05200 [Novosphingobium marinum]|uniref:Uncharacterized protein n=1 Tax=Novosphingobium marinum TaxID=1514948 RepID=A0A7Y9XVT4_9SPHN|nr:hypothetical protein [Novosphingobium marinum]NYH94208.1 hypothetical protein [Novosphingobium marinum]GGC20474.1 hypothetical protein GCM10011371_05200 [Novosphingobium marinum]